VSRPKIVKDTEKEHDQRLLIQTKKPKTILLLGKPADKGEFGYPGISLRADNSWFLSVGGTCRWENGADGELVAGAKWTQYHEDQYIVSVAARAVFGTFGRFVAAAGAGYSAEPCAPTGKSLPLDPYNYTAYNDLFFPIRQGVRDFDAVFEKDNAATRTKLGYTVPARPAAPGAGLLRAALQGTAKPSTHSDAVEKFLDGYPGGLLGALKKTQGELSRIKSWLEDRGSLPFVGPLFDKVDYAQKALNKVQAIQKKATGIPDHAKAVPDKAREAIENLKSNAGDVTEGSALEQAKKALGLVDDAAAIAKDSIGPLLDDVTGIIASVADLNNALQRAFGLMPPEASAVGLVAADGISLLSQETVFGYAANGFHFVSAPLGEVSPSWYQPATLLQQQSEKLKDKAQKSAVGRLFMGKVREAKGLPGFFVRVEDNVEMISQEGSVTLLAASVGATASLEASGAAQVSALDHVGLSARRGHVEILGKTVSLGFPDAEQARKGFQAQKDLADPRKKCDELTVKCNQAQQERRVAENARIKAYEDYQAVLRGGKAPANISPAALLSGAQGPRKAWLDKHEEAIAKRKALLDAEKNLENACKDYLAKQKQKVPLKSPLAEALGWKSEQQFGAQSLVAAVAGPLTLYGGESLSLLSGTKIELGLEAKDGAPDKTAKLTLERGDESNPVTKLTVGKKLLVQVGKFTLTLDEAECTVAQDGKVLLKLDENGPTLLDKQGSKIEVSGGKITMSAGQEVNVMGAQIKLG
jgi:hypothetical protein